MVGRSEMLWRISPPLKIDNIGLKKKYSSFKIYSNTVIELKALAKQCGIKGYYKFRKAELIQKLEPYPELNDQVLIPGLEILRNTTTSVNTSSIVERKILHDNTPVLKPTPKCIAKRMQKIKNFGSWLLDNMQTKPNVVDEALESFKNLTKNCATREALTSNWNSQNLHWKSFLHSTE